MLLATLELRVEVKHFREWMKEKGLSVSDLPDSPFQLPPDCPLYDEDLSLAQAQVILNYIKQNPEVLN